jgi:hypothetical protein
MKLIHVFGDDDYAAEGYLMLNITDEEAYNRAKQCEDDTWEFQQGRYIRAIDFAYDHITDEFVEFAKEVLGDKDLMLSEDFFIVEN